GSVQDHKILLLNINYWFRENSFSKSTSASGSHGMRRGGTRDLANPRLNYWYRENSRRRAGFVRGTHDMRRGGTGRNLVGKQTLYAGHMICEEVARATYCFRGILGGELALYAGHMICEEVAQVVRTEFLESRRKAGFVRGTHDMRRGGTGLNSWNLVGKLALYAGHMICEEVAQVVRTEFLESRRRAGFVRGTHDMRRGGTSDLLFSRNSRRRVGFVRGTHDMRRGGTGLNSWNFVGKLALYAGHMICEEVAQVVRTEFLESRRRAGFVRGTHDMRRGGTSDLLFSRNSRQKAGFVRGTHDMRRGGTEVARATYCSRGILGGELALYAGHMICEEVAQVVRTEFLEFRRKAGFVRGTHDMRRGGTVRTEFLEFRRKAGFVRGTHDMRRGGTGLNSWNLVGELALYAGHMICEEVAQVVRTEFLESRRRAGFVRGTHDMRRGGTSDLLFSRNSRQKAGFVRGTHDMRRGGTGRNLVGKQALYAGHMICEEVARATYCFRGILGRKQALYAGHMICEEVAQVVSTEFQESRRTAGFVRGKHDMRRGGMRHTFQRICFVHNLEFLLRMTKLIGTNSRKRFGSCKENNLERKIIKEYDKFFQITYFKELIPAYVACLILLNVPAIALNLNIFGINDISLYNKYIVLMRLPQSNTKLFLYPRLRYGKIFIIEGIKQEKRGKLSATQRTASSAITRDNHIY
ncbi:LOW QUALITY PROTEIN: hypothetical protein V1477_006015, partial [Vespula maculifrons]